MLFIEYMRRFARFLLVLISFMWLVGLVPAESRACSSTMQADSCCAAEPSCAMECCRVPGNLYSNDLPIAASVPQMPAAPIALKTPTLTPLEAPEALAIAHLEPVCTPPQQALPSKIYLLNRALLI